MPLHFRNLLIKSYSKELKIFINVKNEDVMITKPPENNDENQEPVENPPPEPTESAPQTENTANNPNLVNSSEMSDSAQISLPNQQESDPEFLRQEQIEQQQEVNKSQEEEEEALQLAETEKEEERMKLEEEKERKRKEQEEKKKKEQEEAEKRRLEEAQKSNATSSSVSSTSQENSPTTPPPISPISVDKNVDGKQKVSESEETKEIKEDTANAEPTPEEIQASQATKNEAKRQELQQKLDEANAKLSALNAERTPKEPEISTLRFQIDLIDARSKKEIEAEKQKRGNTSLSEREIETIYAKNELERQKANDAWNADMASFKAKEEEIRAALMEVDLAKVALGDFDNPSQVTMQAPTPKSLQIEPSISVQPTVSSTSPEPKIQSLEAGPSVAPQVAASLSGSAPVAPSAVAEPMLEEVGSISEEKTKVEYKEHKERKEQKEQEQEELELEQEEEAAPAEPERDIEEEPETEAERAAINKYKSVIDAKRVFASAEKKFLAAQAEVDKQSEAHQQALAVQKEKSSAYTAMLPITDATPENLAKADKAREDAGIALGLAKAAELKLNAAQLALSEEQVKFKAAKDLLKHQENKVKKRIHAKKNKRKAKDAKIKADENAAKAIEALKSAEASLEKAKKEELTDAMENVKLAAEEQKQAKEAFDAVDPKDTDQKKEKKEALDAANLALKKANDDVSGVNTKINNLETLIHRTEAKITRTAAEAEAAGNALKDLRGEPERLPANFDMNKYLQEFIKEKDASRKEKYALPSDKPTTDKSNRVEHIKKLSSEERRKKIEEGIIKQDKIADRNEGVFGLLNKWRDTSDQGTGIFNAKVSMSEEGKFGLTIKPKNIPVSTKDLVTTARKAAEAGLRMTPPKYLKFDANGFKEPPGKQKEIQDELNKINAMVRKARKEANEKKTLAEGGVRAEVNSVDRAINRNREGSLSVDANMPNTLQNNPAVAPVQQPPANATIQATAPTTRSASLSATNPTAPIIDNVADNKVYSEPSMSLIANSPAPNPTLTSQNEIEKNIETLNKEKVELDSQKAELYKENETLHTNAQPNPSADSPKSKSGFAIPIPTPKSPDSIKNKDKLIEIEKLQEENAKKLSQEYEKASKNNEELAKNMQDPNEKERALDLNKQITEKQNKLLNSQKSVRELEGKANDLNNKDPEIVALRVERKNLEEQCNKLKEELAKTPPPSDPHTIEVKIQNFESEIKKNIEAEKYRTELRTTDLQVAKNEEQSLAEQLQRLQERFKTLVSPIVTNPALSTATTVTAPTASPLPIQVAAQANATTQPAAANDQNATKQVENTASTPQDVTARMQPVSATHTPQLELEKKKAKEKEDQEKIRAQEQAKIEQVKENKNDNGTPDASRNANTPSMKPS